MRASFETEHLFYQKGYQYIGGIDEVGRGCIAGPVVAACVILNPETFPKDIIIKDSKLLSAQQRQKLVPLIEKHATSIGIGIIGQKRVDEINILQATFEAMNMAIDQGCIKPDMCIVDGNQKIPCDLFQYLMPKADQKVMSVAAASIIAKVYRDNWMIKQAEYYPQYVFDQNKGYGTKKHRQAIAQFGFCDLHRKSFKVRLDE